MAAGFISRNLVLLWLLVALCSAVGPPKQTSPHQARQVAKVGQTKKRFLCPVSADPPLYIQWLKDGDSISDVWTRFKITKEGALRIKDIELEDAGKYVCKVTNGFGSISVNYSLIVVDKDTGVVKSDNSIYQQSPDEDYTREGVPPQFIEQEKMEKKSVIVRPVASSVRFHCRATGNPRPHIHWVKDGRITLESDSAESDTQKPKWTLKLRDLQENDSGSYECVVSNRLGDINFTYALEVIGKMKTKPVMIGPHPRNKTVSIGGIASFQCRVKSLVQPHIQWLKQVDTDSGQEVNHSAMIEVKGQKFVVLKTGDVWKDAEGFYLNKLIMKNIQMSDTGMYICLGANTIGYSFRSAFLIVTQAVSNSRSGQGSGMIHDSSSQEVDSADNSRPGRSEDMSDDGSDGGSGSLPLIIAIPACVAIVVVSLAIFILQRRKRCNANNTPASPHRNTRFNPVPTHERENYPAGGVHINPPLLPTGPPSSSRSGDKTVSSKNHSLDMYSEISSASRYHHQQPPHNNCNIQTYGY